LSSLRALACADYTAWHFVAQVRPAPVPKQVAALLHWGADDHSWSPKIPIHGGASEVHPSYDDFNCTQRDSCRAAHGLPGTVTNFSFESAWWLNQIVADQVYSRKERAAPMVHDARGELEAKLDAMRVTAEAAATAKYLAGDEAGGQAVLNAHAVASGAAATAAWKELWQKLIVTFIDGMTTTLDPKNEVCGCKKTRATFGDAWKAKVVKDAGAHYRVPHAFEAATAIATAQPLAAHGKPTRDKLSIQGVAY
jgi:dipeptidase